MPAFPPRRPFCAHVSLARSITLRFVVGALAATTLLVAAPDTLGAATLEGDTLEHAARNALPLDAGRHALYEPTSNHLVTVELDPLVHDADRLGVEAWGDDGRRLAVDYLGAFDSADGRQIAHWLSAVVVEGQGVGRHVFRVRSLETRRAIGTHELRIVRGDAVRPWQKANDQAPPDDRDSGDILLNDETPPSDDRDSGDILLNDETPPSDDRDSGDILLNDETPPSDDRDNGDILLNDETPPSDDRDNGDILLDSPDCAAGTSVFCPRSVSLRFDGAGLVTGVYRVPVESATSLRVSTVEQTVEVFDSRGMRLAHEGTEEGAALYALPSGVYLVRVSVD
ncbi:MAG: hypothetical protein AAGC60_10695 [Acidobacteriota bacterium]